MKSETKEPKPGEAYFKLKDELSKKISEKRKELIKKRIEEEEQKRKEDESDYDDNEAFEEYSDCGAEDDKEETDRELVTENELPKDTLDDEKNPCGEKPTESYLNDEASESELKNSEDEDEDEDEDKNEDDTDEEDDDEEDVDAESNDEDDAVNKNGTKEVQKRKRIIKAFEDDSDADDNEMEITNGNFELF